MKKIFIVAMFLVGSRGFSQSNCSLQAVLTNDTIICGQTAQLSASGTGGAILMSNDFNSGTAGPGWSVSASAQFNSPCGPSLDNTTHMWMGSTTAAPRTMTTIGYDIGCTGTICFDLAFATTITSPCEEPDLSNEGVDLIYSTDGGATWTSIFYFDPLTGLYDSWANYCFTIPAGAISPNTMFSWTQTNSSGAGYDHWGIDNVNITLTGACADPNPYYYSWLPTTGLSDPSIANPVANPISTTTYTLYFTNGINDTCTAVLPTLTVIGPSADAGVMQLACLGQTAVLQGTGSSNLPAITTYSSTSTTTIPDLTTVTNNITVSGLPYTTISSGDIDRVCLDITHTWDSDLDLYLLCPDGTQLELSTDNGGGGDNYTQTCFTASAVNNITTGTVPFTGNFIPEGAGGFGTFAGCTANGAWSLQITDDVGGDDGVLNNWNITFIVPAVTTASWSPTTDMTGSTTLTPTITPTASGSTQYTLTVTGNPGCVATDTVTLSVAELMGVTASGTATICESDTAALNATGGISYSWAPVTGLSSPSVANPDAFPGTTTNYTVTVSDGTCSKTDSVLITVNQRPPTNAGADVAYCMGDSVQLSATGADTYTWLPVTDLSDPSISNPYASGTGPVTYTVTGTVTATGCFRTDSVTVNVNANPVADAGIDTAFCSGGNVGLLATGGGTYNWLPATNISNSTIANPTVNPPSTMSYSLTVTNSFGCIDRDTVKVIVRNLPVVNAGTNSFVCPGSSVTPASITVTGASPFVYAWTPSATVSDPTIINPAFTPTATPTQYTLTATDVFGCIASDVVTISHRTVPQVNAMAQRPGICPGDSTLLIASPVGSPFPVSYTWTPTGSVDSPNTQNTNTSNSVTGTTTYTVSFTSSAANGSCVGTSTVTVNMYTPPVATAGSDVNLCPAASAQLNGNGGVSYLWSPATGLDNSTLQNPTTNTASLTQYTVTVTDGNGCKDTASVWAIPRPNPVPGTIDATLSGCIFASGSLTMQTPPVGTAPFTYAINGGTPQSSNTFTGLSAGNYTLTVTDVYGCSASGDADVIQATPPVPGAVVSTEAGCTVANGTVSMQAPSGGTPPYTYALNGGVPQGSNTFNGLPTGNYIITVIDANGCSASNAVDVLQSAPPVAGAINSTPTACTSASGTLSMQTPTGTGPFMYSLNGGTNQSSNTFSGLAIGTYTITVTDANGCTVSDNGTVTQQNPPVMNGLTVTTATCTAANGSITVAFPSGGTQPYMYSVNGGTAQTSPVLSSLATGGYTVTVTDASGCTVTDITTVPQQLNTVVVDTATLTSTVCGAAPTGSLVVQNPSGGTAPYTYSINGGTTFQASNTFNNLASANYQVVVMDTHGCVSAVNSFYIGSNINVTAAFTATPVSGPYPLNVTIINSTTGATNYIWDFGNGSATSTAFTPPPQVYSTPGTYTISLTAYNNSPACSNTAFVSVTVFEPPTLVIPNVVTPNNDGLNDEFKMTGFNFKLVEVSIFDRWGRKVTEFSGDINTAVWKPTGISEGTYFYTITATALDDTKQEFSGFISVFDVK